MNPRLRIVVATLTTLLVGALAVAVLAGPDAGEDAAQGFAGALRPATIPPASFELTDQDGDSYEVTTERGRPLVVTFLYSTCEDTCPLQADQIRAALDALDEDGARVGVAIVSVDPAADSERSRRKFLLEHRLTGRGAFLSGPPAQLGEVWREFGIQPQGADGAHDHSGYTVLLDAEGRQRVGFPVDQVTPERLEHDLRLLLGEIQPVG